jgi:hypothetical protein
LIKKEDCYGRFRALRMSDLSPQGTVNTSTDIYVQHRISKVLQHFDISEIITASIFRAVDGVSRFL